MHPHVVEACAALYQRIAHTQGFNQWQTDQAEEALTELVNHPNRSDPPAHQVRNALSNASKKLKRRAQLEQYFSPAMSFGSDRAVQAQTIENTLDIASVLSRMSSLECSLLELAANGADANDIAAELGLSVHRVREQLSRARANARALWTGSTS